MLVVAWPRTRLPRAFAKMPYESAFISTVVQNLSVYGYLKSR
jgi:hypothetical protein